VNFAFLLLAIPICIADMYSFVIPNIYTKFLLCAALIHLVIFGLGRMQGVIISIGLLIFLGLLGIGMGDIKLLGLILITHTYNGIEFISAVLLLAVLHIMVLIAIHRRIPSKIPLAPSIFIGLVTYLAAR
jgi:Flp pilus assembly protein protease CpaA